MKQEILGLPTTQQGLGKGPEAKLGYEASATEARRLLVQGLGILKSSTQYRDALFAAHVMGKGNGPIEVEREKGRVTYKFQPEFIPGESLGKRIRFGIRAPLVVQGADYSGIEVQVTETGAVIEDLMSDPGSYKLEVDRISRQSGKIVRAQRGSITYQGGPAQTMSGGVHYQETTYDPEIAKPLDHQYYSDSDKAVDGIESLFEEYKNDELISPSQSSESVVKALPSG